VYSTAAGGYSVAGVKLGHSLPLAAATHERGQAPNHNAHVLCTGERHIDAAPILKKSAREPWPEHASSKK
jgi:hypothetical protein